MWPLRGWSGIRLVNALSGLLGRLLAALDILNAPQEVQSAVGVLDVLHTHVDVFGDDAASHTLVHNHTHGMWSDVEHSASATMVALVGHTLLHGAGTLDVHNVAALVGLEVGAQRNNT